MENLHILKESAKNLTLLYVEDNDKMREQASVFFKKFFEKTIVAKDGGAGLSAFEKHNPDIVITDISMPVLDGLEMAKKIKEINPNVKIIITSAYDDKEKLMRAIELGVFKYLKKPITIQTLTAALIDCVDSIKIKDNHDDFEEYVQKIFHSQSSLLLFFKKGELKVANQLFLDFFGVKDSEHFQKRYKSIGSLMEKKKGYLHNEESEDWFTKLTSNSGKFFNTLVLGTDMKLHHFLVSANPVPDANDEIIVSLSDVSDLSLSSFEVEESEEPKYPQHNLESLLYVLRVIRDKQEEVKLLNFFKGLNIVNPATIQEAHDTTIVVKTQPTQVKAASFEKSIVLRSPLLSKDLSCEVVKTLFEEGLIVLGSIKQIERSPSQRKFPRLSPANGTIGVLFFNAKEFRGDILDISINAAKLFIPSLPPLNKGENEFRFETKLSIANDNFEIKCSAKSLRYEEKQNGYEVVFLLTLTKEQEHKLVDYISRRQMELIREFKMLKEGA